MFFSKSIKPTLMPKKNYPFKRGYALYFKEILGILSFIGKEKKIAKFGCFLTFHLLVSFPAIKHLFNSSAVQF